MDALNRSGADLPVKLAQRTTLEEIAAIADGATVQVEPAVIVRLEAGQAVLDRLMRADVPTYGLNRRLGHQKTERIEKDEILARQPIMIAAHNGAIGEPLPTRTVRAAMAARAVGLASGASAASPALLNTLIAMLNAGVHPLVPRTGSVGAADLGHMAAIGCVMIGQGRAEYRGEIMDGGAALRAAGITPVTLGLKDGLSMVAGNGLSFGLGALIVLEAERIIAHADMALALSLECIRGNVSVFDPVVASGMNGQRVASDHIRALLEGSYLNEAGASPVIQDPLSFRVAPKVHGAAREMVRFVREAVTTELNTIGENPAIDGERFIHNGNFQPMYLTVAFDALRPALAHIGKIAERRMNHVMREAMHRPGGASLGHASLLFLYAASARVAEMRQLANPASLDSPPLDFDIEDHATNAPLSVEHAARLIDCLDDVLAVEMMFALEMSEQRRGEDRYSPGTEALRRQLCDALAAVPVGASPNDNHAAVVAALKAGRIGAPRQN